MKTRSTASIKNPLRAVAGGMVMMTVVISIVSVLEQNTPLTWHGRLTRTSPDITWADSIVLLIGALAYNFGFRLFHPQSSHY